MIPENKKQCIDYSSPGAKIISASEKDKRKWTEHTGTYYVVNKLTSMAPEIWQLKVIHTTSNHGAEETVFYNILAGGKHRARNSNTLQDQLHLSITGIWKVLIPLALELRDLGLKRTFTVALPLRITGMSF
ncbi:hypothetical protein [Enterobacter bugandensis]|uniref:hypothetical protein n=1 Tax=Enterobacter bugandensis TaxID=881260 RepID=UPI0021D31936|nr:hypothetical protein [Enterobacter bugandensis]MCU6172415.1 hypothetical protein [Enterobacter bugandensis]